MPAAPIQVGARVFLHDNPSTPPLAAEVVGLEHFANGTQMAKIKLDHPVDPKKEVITVPANLLRVATT
ncbi:hypothetical protein FRC01_001693 [Tulasnella sp. 417]|nr:hypothetical protein FRC01_001693 [Tulasnella sp. 417]